MIGKIKIGSKVKFKNHKNKGRDKWKVKGYPVYFNGKWFIEVDGCDEKHSVEDIEKLV